VTTSLAFARVWGEKPGFHVTRSFRKPAFVAMLVAAAIVMRAAPVLADEPERPTYVNPDVYPPPEAQWQLALVGLGVTAVWYGLAAGFSYMFPDAPGANDLRKPVIGPWMALADTGCADDDPGCSKFVVILRAILTTIDAVGQTGGIAAIGEAVFMPTQEPTPGQPRPRSPPRLKRQSWQIRPGPVSAGKGGIGFGVVGSF
jgi:hypothetical protein